MDVQLQSLDQVVDELNSADPLECLDDLKLHYHGLGSGMRSDTSGGLGGTLLGTLGTTQGERAYNITEASESSIK